MRAGSRVGLAAGCSGGAEWTGALALLWGSGVGLREPRPRVPAAPFHSLHVGTGSPGPERLWLCPAAAHAGALWQALRGGWRLHNSHHGWPGHALQLLLHEDGVWGRGASVLPARPRRPSHTHRTGECPEAPRGRPPSRKTAARKPPRIRTRRAAGPVSPRRQLGSAWSAAELSWVGAA